MILLVVSSSILIRQDELKGQLVLIEIVDKVPEDVLIRLPHLLHIELNFI